jgi:hypothetical protein
MHCLVYEIRFVALRINGDVWKSFHYIKTLNIHPYSNEYFKNQAFQNTEQPVTINTFLKLQILTELFKYISSLISVAKLVLTETNVK